MRPTWPPPPASGSWVVRRLGLIRRIQISQVPQAAPSPPAATPSSQHPQSPDVPSFRGGGNGDGGRASLSSVAGYPSSSLASSSSSSTPQTTSYSGTGTGSSFGPLPPAWAATMAAAATAAGVITYKARVAVLFASGHFCVFHLDAANKLSVAPGAGVGACQRLGVRALDLAWMMPTSPPASSGAGEEGGRPGGSGGGPGVVLAAVSEEGGLVLLDVGGGATAARRQQQQQQQRPGAGVLGGAGPPSSPQPLPAVATSQPTGAQPGRRASAGGDVSHDMSLVDSGSGRWWLAPAPSLGSCLLLPRPWALLLRLLLQVGKQRAGHTAESCPPEIVPPAAGRA